MVAKPIFQTVENVVTSTQPFCKVSRRKKYWKQSIQSQAVDLWKDLPYHLKDLRSFSFPWLPKRYLRFENAIWKFIGCICSYSRSVLRVFFYYWVAVWQSQSELGGFFFCFVFSVSVKVLPVTPLLSGVFVHRAFCSYFLRIGMVVEMRRFLCWTQ